jgi:predicted nucleic acid-binding protein
MKVYFDTAVLVAASVSDHPHHSRAIAALQMVRTKEIVGHVSGHGLAEAYAVLSGGGMETALRECTPIFSDRGSDAGDVSRDDSRMRRGRMDWWQDLRRFASILREESRLRSNLHFQHPPLSTIGSRLGGPDRRALAVPISL